MPSRMNILLMGSRFRLLPLNPRLPANYPAWLMRSRHPQIRLFGSLPTDGNRLPLIEPETSVRRRFGAALTQANGLTASGYYTASGQTAMSVRVKSRHPFAFERSPLHPR